MNTKKYIDPYPTLPSMERCIIKLRSFEMALVLFYSEQIRREVLDMAQTPDRLKARRDPNFRERVPERKKNAVKHALNALEADGAITAGEKKEIAKYSEFRDAIAHHIDHLFSDMEPSRFLGTSIDMRSEVHPKRFRRRSFDHAAAIRMKEILILLGEVSIKKQYVTTFRSDGYLLFSATETILENEISKLRERLYKFSKQRNHEIEKTNKELKIGYGILNGKRREQYFDWKYFQGKLTKRGEELCYLFFDAGLSTFTVAHIFEMMLPSIQKRQKRWREIGGNNRDAVDFNAIPVVITPSRFDD
ncbi:MAG: hypothetical protein L3J30_04685 [Marinosulfonomonas sp.]|nr:hypothetical protein [Marinosulfonomonas sp.]